MKKWGLLLIIFACLSLQARFVKTKESMKKYNLRDGSTIKGIKMGEDRDSLYIKNEILGMVSLPKQKIKYSGENLNNGTLLSITPFSNEEKDQKFQSTNIYTLGSAKILDERFSTSIDIDYMYHDFNKVTSKYMENSADADNPYCGVIHHKFQYKTHFFMPTFAFRFSILPTSWLEGLTRRIHLYPYVSVGAGYSLGFVKYKIQGTTSEGLTSDDYENKMHYYTGPIYKASIGCSWKISSHVALVIEGMYHNVTFKQNTSEKEEQSGMELDKFILEGFKPSFGIRFGDF